MFENTDYKIVSSLDGIDRPKELMCIYEFEGSEEDFRDWKYASFLTNSISKRIKVKYMPSKELKIMLFFISVI